MPIPTWYGTIGMILGIGVFLYFIAPFIFRPDKENDAKQKRDKK